MMPDIRIENCLDTMKDMASESVDLVVTSPPYDNLRTYNGYSFDFESIAKELLRIIKPGGVIVWVVNDAAVDGSKTGSSFRQALTFKQLGLNLHDTMIWQKPNFAPLFPSVKRYDQNFEFVFVLSKGQPKSWNPIKDRPKSEASKSRMKYGITYIQKDGSRSNAKVIDNQNDFSKRTSVWIIPNGQKRGLNHPAVFPEQLAADHILSWSNPDDLVYDPFTGSGTTGLAAKKLGRKFIGSEISADYAQAAIERIKNG
jgi:site-specific DNA-methyltransferase (adenine-specific)